MYKHKTLRKYTSAIISLFNNKTIDFVLDDGTIIQEKIPMKFANSEKNVTYNEYDVKNLLNGNSNFYPRGAISLVGLSKSLERNLNKNHKINTHFDARTGQYQYNSSAYDFNYTVSILARGMNQVSEIIETFVPMFNPVVNVDVYDAYNLNKPTRIPIHLEDISLTPEDYGPTSANMFLITFRLILNGQIYQPVSELPRIKEFDLVLNKIIDEEDNATRLEMFMWDVGPDGMIVTPKEVENETRADNNYV